MMKSVLRGYYRHKNSEDFKIKKETDKTYKKILNKLLKEKNEMRL
ncbi:hypothetical protein U8V72_19545 [Priestia filamentosa]